MIAQIYQAAAHAGLLTRVRWYSRSHGSKELWVEWRQTDDTMLHDLVVGMDIAMTAPTSQVDGMTQGDRIVRDQHDYRVREIRCLHDGSETRVTLAEY